MTKVYLPIVIILFVTLSTLFIHPKELESRLTVAVVCFLALIAYTYVVEKDLPQLSYLTAMDKMIENASIKEYYPAMNKLIASAFHMIKVFDHQEPEVSNFSDINHTRQIPNHNRFFY